MTLCLTEVFPDLLKK